jgi:hypothetical protein
LFSARYHGIKYQDVVPDWRKKSRGDEIRGWLAKHREVDRYAIIDDDDDELDDLPLFQPSSATGLTARITIAVARYLSRKSDNDMRSGRIVRTLENARKRIKRLTK